jgi:CheY-like chemotaxis protein
MVAAFEYRQAVEVRDALARHGARYLFIGKSGAILLGFPDTTQDAVLFVDQNPENGRALVAALVELGFNLTEAQSAEIIRGKDFIQLKNGPFDLDLVFAPDGIERFEDAWTRRVEVDGFPVCHLDDIIASKEAADRVRDRESLPRLRAFREYWIAQRHALKEADVSRRDADTQRG